MWAAAILPKYVVMSISQIRKDPEVNDEPLGLSLHLETINVSHSLGIDAEDDGVRQTYGVRIYLRPSQGSDDGDALDCYTLYDDDN